MKLIVDSNVLFTYFWEDSLIKKLLMKINLELFSPEFALEEINKYKEEIIRKTKISQEEFKRIRTDIAIAVEFIPIEEYKAYFNEALKISPDKNDADFFALALKFKIPIWSNDSLLKKQNKIKIFSTQDLLEKKEFFEAIFVD